MRLLLICLLTLSGLALRAQLIEFSGHVLEVDTNRPIPNVAVTVDSIEWTFTNKNGLFSLKCRESKKMILFSCIGYYPYYTEISAHRNEFVIQLQREYLPIEKVEIDSLSRAFHVDSSRNFLNRQDQRMDIVMDAEYPGGLKYLQYDLTWVIRKDSIYSFRFLNDKLVEVKFEVDALGRMKALYQNDDSVKFQLDKYFPKLKKWKPAIQNRIYVPQYFEMMLTWPKGIAGNAVENRVFLVVDEPAIPKGGMMTFYQYVGENLKYPEEAIKKNVVGKVFVEFIIETSGEISNVKTIRGIGEGCDEEAVRVVSQSPDWKPGSQKGKPVRQKMIIPIAFSLGHKKWSIN